MITHTIFISYIISIYDFIKAKAMIDNVSILISVIYLI